MGSAWSPMANSHQRSSTEFRLMTRRNIAFGQTEGESADGEVRIDLVAKPVMGGGRVAALEPPTPQLRQEVRQEPIVDVSRRHVGHADYLLSDANA